MDKIILKKWLETGYIEQQQLKATTLGVPQGGVISPTLLTITLSGLEKAISAVTNPRTDKVNTIIYADDFVITGATKEILEQKVRPVVEEFLTKRGLKLSEEKTSITHIDQGFDFLGHNIRKYNEKLLIKPSKNNVNVFLANIRDIIKRAKATKTEDLINILNPKIRGWANYYRHVVSKAVFSKVDNDIFLALWAWAKRRHRNKGHYWIARKYFCSINGDNWVFNAGSVTQLGRSKVLRLLNANAVPIKRHIKIRAEAIPYDPKYKEYFARRERLQRWVKSTGGNIAGSDSLAL